MAKMGGAHPYGMCYVCPSFCGWSVRCYDFSVEISIVVHVRAPGRRTGPTRWGSGNVELGLLGLAVHGLSKMTSMF